MKKHADELNRMGIPSGHQLALLQRTRDEKIKEIEAQEEPKKEESRGEKKTDKAADPIYQVQQKKKKPQRSMTVNVKRLARSMTKRLMKFEARLTNCTKATIRMLLRSVKNCGTL